MSLSPHKRAWLRLFLACIAILSASLVARGILIAEPQTWWTARLGVLLRGAELFAGFGAILLALAALSATIYPRRKAARAKIAAQRGRV
jgi:hypothetical protein